MNIIWGPRWDTVLRAVAREGGWLLMGGSDRVSPVLPGRLRDRVEFRMEEGVYVCEKDREMETDSGYPAPAPAPSSCFSASLPRLVES